VKLKPDPDLKRDLLMAYWLLEERLTEAEEWEVYAAIEFDRYDYALTRMSELAGERRAADVQELLIEISTRSTRR
jgi:hypothetical protein